MTFTNVLENLITVGM